LERLALSSCANLEGVKVMSSQSKAVVQTTVGMKLLLYLASALVLAVGLTLFLFPEKTDTLFSWTINPALTAAFLGAAYLAAFVLEFLGARETIWARARVAVPAVLIFTVLTLVATLLHIGKFHFGPEFSLLTQAGTWVWLLVYAIVPVAMAVLLVLQLRTPGIDPPRTAPLPGSIRLVFICQAAVAITLGIALFVVPTQTAELIWSWLLTPLTGRAVGAWLVGVGVAAGHIAWENDWLRVRAGSIAFAVFAGLQLIVLVRFAFAQTPAYAEPIVDWGDLRAWLYLTFLVSMLVVGVYGWWASRRAVQSL
jgi:hypothetical protein